MPWIGWILLPVFGDLWEGSSLFYVYLPFWIQLLPLATRSSTSCVLWAQSVSFSLFLIWWPYWIQLLPLATRRSISCCLRWVFWILYKFYLFQSGLYNISVISLVTIFLLSVFWRSQITSIYTVARQLIIEVWYDGIGKFSFQWWGYGCSQLVIQCWFPPHNLRAVFWFYFYHTINQIFRMGLRWWAHRYFHFWYLKHLYVFSIDIGGMVSSCFGGINLALVFCLTLQHLQFTENIIGSFSWIHFWFLLSLANYFSILLSVSSALSLDIFWLSVVVCWKWNCFLSLWLNAF